MSGAVERLAGAGRSGRAGLTARLERLRDQWPQLAQIGVAVLLSWFLATRLLGHDRPFFAPVTAILSLGLTYGQRLRRIVEVTVGVAIGVFVGDVVVLVLGGGAWQMALVVVSAMALATVVSTGPLLRLQSGVQAVFIVAFVATTGEGISRWLDAALGGVVALVIGTLAPTAPIARPRRVAARTLREVAATLASVAAALRARDQHGATAALERARSLESSIVDLRSSAAEGVAVVRQSPLLRRHRDQAIAGTELVVPLDHCVRNLRILARRAVVALTRDEPVPPAYVDLVASLGAAADDLARVLDEHTRPEAGRAVLDRVAAASAVPGPGEALSAEMLRGQVRSILVDLFVLTGLDEDVAARRLPGPTR